MSDEELEQNFKEMKDNGENVLRFSTAGWIDEEPYLLEERVGVFNEEHAKRIDNIFDIAEELGMDFEQVLNYVNKFLDKKLIKKTV